MKKLIVFGVGLAFLRRGTRSSEFHEKNSSSKKTVEEIEELTQSKMKVFFIDLG